MTLESRWLWIAVLLHAGCVGPVFKLSPSDARLLFKLRRNADFSPLINQGFIKIRAMRGEEIRGDKRRRDKKATEKKPVANDPKEPSRKEPSRPVNLLGRFDEFWTLYPNKVKKKKSMEYWAKRNLDGVADKILADVRDRLELDRDWKSGHIQHPTTYINDERWNDESIQTRTASDETYAEKAERIGRELDEKFAKGTLTDGPF